MNASYIIIGLLVLIALIIIIDAFRRSKDDVEDSKIKTEYLFPDGSVISSYTDTRSNKFYVSIPVTTNFSWEYHRFISTFKDKTPGRLYIFGVYNDESKQKPLAVPIMINLACYPTIVYTDDLGSYIANLYGRDRCILFTPNNIKTNSKYGDIYEDS